MSTGLETANLIINGIAAISAAIQAYLTAKGGMPSVQRPKDRFATEEVADELAAVIDSRVLLVISANISVARSSLVLCLEDDAKNDEDKDLAVENARKAICSELRRIRTLNLGQLPSVYFESQWKSYGCSTN